MVVPPLPLGSTVTTIGLSTPPQKLQVFHDSVLTKAAALVNARVKMLQDKENMPPLGSPAAVAAVGGGSPRAERRGLRKPLSVVVVRDDCVEAGLGLEDEDEESNNNEGRYIYLNVSFKRIAIVLQLFHAIVFTQL